MKKSVQYKHTRIKKDAEKDDIPLIGSPLCLHEKECSQYKQTRIKKDAEDIPLKGSPLCLYTSRGALWPSA